MWKPCDGGLCDRHGAAGCFRGPPGLDLGGGRMMTGIRIITWEWQIELALGGKEQCTTTIVEIQQYRDKELYFLGQRVEATPGSPSIRDRTIKLEF